MAFRPVVMLACAVTVGCTGSGSGPAAGPIGASGGAGGAVGIAGAAGAGNASGGTGWGGAGGGGAAAPLVFAWEPCPLATGGTGNDAECATVSVPLRWEEPDREHIALFVKRLRTTSQRRGALWMLDGGLVSSSVELEAAIPWFAGKAAGLDVYTMDHRGTGRSTRLGCPAEESEKSEGGIAITDAEVAGCATAVQAQWGTDLAHFRTTAAARDLHASLVANRAPGDVAMVYGISYGTYVAHRYLQLYPSEPTGVVLEAPCLPGVCTMSAVDGWTEDLGVRFFAECDADPFCGGKLGPSSYAKTKALLASLDTGHCPELVKAGLGRSAVRMLIGNTIAYGGWSLRPLAAALVYRLARCNLGDVAALGKLAGVVLSEAPGGPPVGDRFASLVTGYGVAFSELWESPPPTIAALEAVVQSSGAANGQSLSLARAREHWPTLPVDPLTGTWAVSSAPLLVLRGGLDFVPASVADATLAHFASAHQHVVMVPRAPHATVFAPTKAGKSCSGDMMEQFFADPTAPLDTSCTADMASIDWQKLPAGYAVELFGSSDFWEGIP